MREVKRSVGVMIIQIGISGVRLFERIAFFVFCLIFAAASMVTNHIVKGVVFAKTYYLVCIVSCTLFLLSVRLLRDNFVVDVNVRWTDLLVALYVFAVFVRLFFSPHGIVLGTRLLELSVVVAGYYLCRFLMARFQDRSHFVILSLLLFGLCQAILSLCQLYGLRGSYHPIFKVTGTFFNPALVAGYLCSILPVALAFFNRRMVKNAAEKVLKKLGLITSAAIVLVLPSTDSRAGFVAAAVGLAVVYGQPLFRYGQKLNGNRVVKYISLGLMVGLCAACAIALFSYKQNSALGRLLAWKINTRIVADHPWFGAGYDQYSAVYGTYQANYFKENEDSNDKMFAGKGEYAFNELQLIAVEMGLTGFVLFVVMITSAFVGWNNLRLYQDPLALGAAAGIISLLVFSMFSYPFSSSPIFFNFFFFLGILAGHNGRTVFVLSRRPSAVSRYGVVIVIWVCCFLSVDYVYRHYAAAGKWLTASMLAGSGAYTKAVETMKEAEPLLKHHGQFMLEYGQMLLMHKKFSDAVDKLQRAASLTADPYLFISLATCYENLGEDKTAEYYYHQAYYLMPYKIQALYLLANHYARLGKRDESQMIANKVLTMEIKVPSAATDQIRNEMLTLISKDGSVQ
jgi:O-antigen polymerase